MNLYWIIIALLETSIGYSNIINNQINHNSHDNNRNENKIQSQLLNVNTNSNSNSNLNSNLNSNSSHKIFSRGNENDNNKNNNDTNNANNNNNNNNNKDIPKNQSDKVINIDKEFAFIDLYDMYDYLSLSETEIKSMEVLFYHNESEACVKEFNDLGKLIKTKINCQTVNQKYVEPDLLKTCSKTQSALYFNNLLKYVIFAECLKNEEGQLCHTQSKQPTQNYFQCDNTCFIAPVQNLNSLYELTKYSEDNLSYIKIVDEMNVLKENIPKIVEFCEDPNNKNSTRQDGIAIPSNTHMSVTAGSEEGEEGEEESSSATAVSTTTMLTRRFKSLQSFLTTTFNLFQVLIVFMCII